MFQRLAVSLRSRHLFRSGTTMEVSLQDRFRGCMLGGVCGDGLGAHFENSFWMSTVKVEKVMKRFQDAAKHCRNPAHRYTDDTSMAFTLSKSLLENGGFREKYLAMSFAHAFEREPNRGYGGSVIVVFNKLLMFSDAYGRNVFAPAQEQFDGSGSYGNGAAMRAAPIALFAQSQQELVEIASNQALLTHAHPDAVCGAVWQAAATRFVLLADRSVPFSCSALLSHLGHVTTDFFSAQPESKPGVCVPSPMEYVQRHADFKATEGKYMEKLTAIRRLLKDTSATQEQIAEQVGHGIEASEAVPAAVFVALRLLSQENRRRFDIVKDDGCGNHNWVTASAPSDAGDAMSSVDVTKLNLMQETIVYAISLGGDTDTIACMAGAIVGAYCGGDSFMDSWSDSCEGYSDAKELADKFFSRHCKFNSRV